MLTISQEAWDALSRDGRRNFVQALARFIESDFPEHATVDGAHAGGLAERLLARSQHLGLVSRESVLRYASAMLGYAWYDPEGFAWIDELMQDQTLEEEFRILFMEQRLYGRPVWAE